MRRNLLVFCLVACLALPTRAADEPLDAPRIYLRVEAQKYAEVLQLVALEISESYVRPVSADDLLTAGLTALYQTASVPVPAGLRERVGKAVKSGGVTKFLAEAREAVGNGDPVRGERALLVSCRGMMTILDPYCELITAAERGVGDVTEHNFGVGIELAPSVGVGPLIVRAVVPGGPAQRAGVQPGDRISRIDGKEVKGLSSVQALAALNGPSPEMLAQAGPASPLVAFHSVKFTLTREGLPAPFEVKLDRQSFKPEMVYGLAREPNNAWDYWVDRKKRIAHVRLGRLGHGAAEEMQEVMRRLDSGEGLGGLVLDLRWCPGGFLREALGVASLFLADGTHLATVKYRTEETRSWRVGDASPDGPDLPGPTTRHVAFPMVVLVNGETSGGGELIAAALADHGRAAIIGQRTRGKASVQDELRRLPLPQGASIKLTTGLFLRPSGENLNRFADSKPADTWGVRPDAGGEVRLSPALGRQLRDAWEELTVRPGRSTRRLLLDDPSADPQRVAAIKKLHAMLAAR